MAPGPELGVVLSTVDRTRLGSSDLFDLVEARSRQLAYEQAQLLADVYESGRAAHETEHCLTRREPDEFAANQIAWTLAWSRSYAQGQLHLAQELTGRLPMVWAAMAAGRLDQAKAAAFVDTLADLDEDTARLVATKLLDRAQRWTLPQLRERLRYHAHKADPTLTKRRYEKAVVDRQVWLQPYTDGTAMLAGANLAPHRAAAAFDHVDRLARAAKAAGDPRTLPQLRADAYVALLTGQPFRRQPPTDPLTEHADTTAAAEGTVRDDPDDLAGQSPIGRPRHRTPRASTRTRRRGSTRRPARPARTVGERRRSRPTRSAPTSEPIGRATFDPPTTRTDYGEDPERPKPRNHLTTGATHDPPDDLEMPECRGTTRRPEPPTMGTRPATAVG